MLSRLRLPESVAPNRTATALLPPVSVTACDVVPQVAQFAVAGSENCLVVPLTTSDIVRAPPVPFAYRKVIVVLPALPVLTVKVAAAFPRFASTNPPT
jgi:hypothetical protein